MPASDTQAIIDAVTKLGAERDALKGGGAVTAKLLISEDFAGGRVTSPYLQFYSSTPQAYGGDIQPFVSYAGKSCGHYYAQQGTNEKTPWEVTVGADAMAQLFPPGTASEFCIEWQEYFVGGYPWATAGQKMCRFIYNNSLHPASNKSAEIACLDSGRNMQAGAYWNSGEWFQNTGLRHPMDTWTTWRWWMKLNSAGRKDGFIRVTQNGRPYLSAESVKLREDADELGFNMLWIGGNYSQVGGVGALPNNGHRYVSGIRLWNTSPG
jgi:hypothetical protein